MIVIILLFKPKIPILDAMKHMLFHQVLTEIDNNIEAGLKYEYFY